MTITISNLQIFTLLCRAIKMNESLSIDIATRDAWLALDDKALLNQCEVDTYRSSGPGGQKRNKTDSAVRLRHLPTGLIVIAPESRSQHENRARAVRRMRIAFALFVRVQIEADSFTPGPILAECIRKGKLRVGKRDLRYGPVVAEVLDLIAACEVQVSTAAARLGITTAGLVSFIQNDPKLADRVNQMRTQKGLKRLR